ncbi:hypothetical protein [Actinoplanes sp. GCM10030250]|uniref:hypothetical protein n=1 Tax=Actinoplanes sp. GCM10030250 TaxID=3273376 RepID=UPI00360C799E
MPDVQDWRAAGARIDALIDAETAGRDRAEELVRVVTGLYGAGLERLLGVLHDAGALTDEVVAAVAGDDLVAGLLLVHGLHPYDTATRVAAALAGTGVELVEVTASGVCRLRVSHGHPPAGLEEIVEAAAPEVTGIEVAAKPALIPVASLFARVAEPT